MMHESTKYVLVAFIVLFTIGASPVGEKDPVSSQRPPDTGQELISANAPLSPKTLDRRFDPVVVRGDLLDNLHDLRIDNFRLYAWSDKQFVVIPFQVDERDPEGEYVFTGGKFAGADEDNGLFDHNDELVFMAKDMGAQAPKAVWSGRGHKGAEVVVSDPIDASKKGWAYFIHFSKNPPPLSKENYVDYFPEEEVVRATYYHLGYAKGAPLYTDLSIPKEVGGNGEDFFDRIKIRIKVKTLFNLISVKKTEEDFIAETVGWKDGPVRVLRNVQTRFRILFNLASPSIFSVSEYYAHFMYTPLQITIPFNLKWAFHSFGISDWNWFFYADFPGLKNGIAYTNRNRQGHVFTGHHSQEYLEKNIDRSNIVWGFNTKEGVGTWFPRLVLPDIMYQSFKLYIVDDETFIDPPEDVPGVIGAGIDVQWKGVNEDLWFMLEKGTYELTLDSYFPRPGMRVEEVDEWLNIRDFPLWVDIAEKQGKGTMTAISTSTEGDEKSTIIKKAAAADHGFCGVVTDVRGRKFPLYQVSYYVGSSRATPRTFILGETMSDKKYHRPEFEEIKRIEHRLEKEDPLTRMKNPMFQKVFKRDGKVLDLMSCKPCGFSGRLPDGQKIFLWNTQIHSVDFEECPSP